ncbi:MAG: hypothetical protein OEV49_05360 [candidate division Zixibacteria bacterium]|nr:hypothetical protein [candidate division Zixibacteria bacterium]MDH3936704.1 hypothetical protein [candidate division Zixibacteria bacterium]
MTYVQFKDRIANELRKNPAGFTWNELKVRLKLPYDRPCPTWVNRMETDIGLSREKGPGRAYIWTLG